MFRFSQLSRGRCLHEFIRAVVLHPTREQELRGKQTPPETKVPHPADSETLGLIEGPLNIYKVAIQVACKAFTARIASHVGLSFYKRKAATIQVFLDLTISRHACTSRRRPCRIH